jgi:hypothetical protein
MEIGCTGESASDIISFDERGRTLFSKNRNNGPAGQGGQHGPVTMAFKPPKLQVRHLLESWPVELIDWMRITSS